MGQVRLVALGVQEDMASQVVGALAGPAIDLLARRQVEGHELASVELADVEPRLGTVEGDAADHPAGGQLAGHLPGGGIDLANGAGVLVRDPQALAGLVGDDAVRLGGHVNALDDLTGLGVEDDDLGLMVAGRGGKRTIADPGDALGLLADGDFAERLFAGGVDNGDRSVVQVGGEEAFAVGGDVEQAVRGTGEHRRGGE